MADARGRDIEARLLRIAEEFSRTHAALARNAARNEALCLVMAQLCRTIHKAIDQSRRKLDRITRRNEAVSRPRAAAAGGLERRSTGLPPARLRKVLDHIDASLAERLNVATLAEVAGMSPSHFATMFKQATGLPPHEAVLRRRLARAQDLLRDEALTIAVIGSQLGFCSQAHFTTVFRLRLGLPPHVWRVRQRQRRTAVHDHNWRSLISPDAESRPQESESQWHPLRALMEVVTEPPRHADTGASHPGTA
jgi:AraC-like DNA-binding protein